MAEPRLTAAELRLALRFWLGLGAVAAVAFAVSRWLFMPPPVPLPDGWTVFRPPHDVQALGARADGMLAGGRDGLHLIRFADGQVRRLLPPDGDGGLFVNAILPDTGLPGGAWVGTDRGLFTDLQHGRSDTRVPGEVKALAVAADNAVWAGGWQGLTVIDRTTGDAGGLQIGNLTDMVNVITLLPARRRDATDSMACWLGSYSAPSGGLTVWDGRQIAYFTTANGLPHNNINAIVPVGDREVWVATGFLDRGGVAVMTLADTGWHIARTLTASDGLAGAKARSLFVHPDGTIFVGSEYDGLAYLRQGRWRVLTTADGLCHNEIKVMTADVQGNLWLGTRDGVLRLSAAAVAALP